MGAASRRPQQRPLASTSRGHGHFTGDSDRHVFVLGGGGRDGFSFNNFYWNVAAYDYSIVGNSDGIARVAGVVIYRTPTTMAGIYATNPRLQHLAHVDLSGKLTDGAGSS